MAEPKFKGAFELFEPSTKIIQENLLAYAVLLVTPTVLASLGTRNDLTTFLTFIGILLSLALLPPLTKLYLLTAKGKTPKIKELFNGSYRYFPRLIGLGLIVGLLIVGGLILLIVPGIIMMRRYALSYLYLVDKDLSIKEAMQMSSEQTKPYSWKIYSVLGVVFLIGIVSGIGGVIGLMLGTILSILYSVALPIRYYEIKKANQA